MMIVNKISHSRQRVTRKEITYMDNYNSIPDISQQYEEEPFRYTRRLIEEEPPIEIIAECHLCGVLIADNQEVFTYADNTFCSKYHVDEYKDMESEREVA